MSKIIDAAAAFAARKHGKQKRKYTGEPYMMHLMNVAALVLATGAPDYIVAAALLHDTLEDTETTDREIQDIFGKRVVDIVVELTDVFVQIPGEGNRATRKVKEAARLATVSAAAQTIKVADLIDNTASIVKHDPKFAKVYLAEKKALLAVLTKAEPTLMAQAKEQLN